MTQLAGLDPVLAYRIGSKAQVGPMLQQLASITIAQAEKQPINPTDLAVTERFWAWLDRMIEKHAFIRLHGISAMMRRFLTVGSF